MELHYASNKLKKILESERLLKRHYSSDYRKIAARLTELKLAGNLMNIPEVPPPRRYKLTGKYDGCWGIDYSKNDRIVISPVGEYDINNLETIVEVQVIDLVDYH